MPAKICSTCKEPKDLSHFGKNKYAKDGIRSQCKECEKAYRVRNSERIKQQNAEYMRTHREGARASLRRYYYKSRGREVPSDVDVAYQRPPNEDWEPLSQDEINARKRAYKHSRYEEWREWEKKYNHSEKGRTVKRIAEQRRHALEVQSVCSITKQEIEFLFSFQDGKCARCGIDFGNEVQYTLDHIVPLSKGGHLVLDNVQLLCRSCNSYKHDRTIMYRKPLPSFYSELT